MPAFSAGLMLGGLLSGVIAGIAGGLLSVLPYAWRLGILAVPLAIIMVFELAGRPLSLPQNRRLVPQEIIPRHSFDGPFQFGFEMGTGVRTYSPTALPHALVLVIALLGGLGPGVLAGLGFGFGRILMPYVRSRAADAHEWDGVLLSTLPWLGRVCAAGFVLALTLILW
ncbi:hypothetical protein QLQ12_30995 [Actinoplanes sp. NEAU-A12]|uniref:Major facilitator superfamily (MFS) profile domain-containing protein n=1 Tax=Actinoplanes sandaracinus TaxID=3045177 RepID=A0ABT6WTI1_9ACTN|nr:hypothetical protein [Actinoplanes sandaracinus]MDI6103051.1 hypothetical protein [Actinoplanes sandaracinus]